VRWGLWLRFSVVLLALSVVGLVECVLLSPFGFGWFLLALAITLYVVKKFAPRLLLFAKEISHASSALTSSAAHSLTANLSLMI